MADPGHWPTWVQVLTAVYLLGVPADYISSRYSHRMRLRTALVIAPLWPVFMMASIMTRISR